MAAAAAAAASTTTGGKLADSTDASSERYSPSSSCNAPDGQDFPIDPLSATARFISTNNNNTSSNNNNNNNSDNEMENDCDMPTDLSMPSDSCERRLTGATNGSIVKVENLKIEKMASWFVPSF